MTVKGEDYAPLGSTELSTIADKVKAAGADAVFNTPNGDSDVAFFKEYKAKYGEAKPFDPEKVRAAASGTAFEAPEGTVTVDGKSQDLAGAELSLLLALPVAFLVAGVLGVAVIIDAFLVIVAGGIGRLRGCVVAAFVLGVLRGAYGSGGTPAAVRARSGPRPGYGHFPGAHRARNGHRSAPRNRLPLG